MNLRIRNPIRNKNIYRLTFLSFLIISILMGASLTGCTTKPPAGKLIISVSDAYQLYQNGVFMLDVRTPEEYQEAHIPGSTLIPLDQLNARYGELPLDETIVVYCRSGNRSLEAVTFLDSVGFDRVHSMDRGINYWIQMGYEVEK